MERQVTGRDVTGARIERLTTSRAVETADLDLRYSSDVGELHRRLNGAAANACREIEESTANMLITTRSQCLRNALRSAVAQADALVDDARG